MIGKKHQAQGASVGNVLRGLELSKSSYYYGESGGRKGAKPSRQTLHKDGKRYGNGQVVEKIKDLLNTPFVDYGYIKTSHWLKQQGFIINKKKVYRLMKENHLLKGNRRVKTTGKRNFVKYSKLTAEFPYQYLEMDIKYLYVPAESKNVYLLSLLDVYSREVICYQLAHSMKSWRVKEMLRTAFKDFNQVEHITLRTDNGSQFLAHKTRQYLKDIGVVQEFTHVATPQENAHIEAFHSILEREVIRRHQYHGFNELKMVIEGFIEFYNQKRIHSAIGYKSPAEYLEEYYLSLSDKQQKVEAEGLSRVETIGSTCLALDNPEATTIFVDRNDDKKSS